MNKQFIRSLPTLFLAALVAGGNDFAFFND